MKLPRFEDEHVLAKKLKTVEALESYEKILIGKKIKALRTKARLHQKQLAAFLKTTQSVIARIEAGKQNLTIRSLIMIAAFLGKKVEIVIK